MIVAPYLSLNCRKKSCKKSALSGGETRLGLAKKTACNQYTTVFRAWQIKAF
jgi:hypothetical protein